MFKTENFRAKNQKIGIFCSKKKTQLQNSAQESVEFGEKEQLEENNRMNKLKKQKPRK